MKLVSSHKGGEYHGPCPGCGGDDRFHVWPEQNGGQGSYWCRGCGKGGDLIQFLIDFCSKTFPEAARLAGKKINGKLPYIPSPPKTKGVPGPEWVPASTPDMDHRTEKWKEHACRLVEWATGQLVKSPETMDWLAARGIGKEAAAEFKLGLNTGKNGKDLWRPRESWGLPTVIKKDGKKKRLWIPRGLVIPYVVENDIVRVRIRRFGTDEPRYYVVPGSSMQVMVLGFGRRAHVVVESELDAIMVFSRVGDLGVGTIGLGSSSAKPDSVADEQLLKSLCVLNALDFDIAGVATGNWWKKRYKEYVDSPVPLGKDPGEAFQAGIDIREWVRAQLPPAITTAPSRLFQAKNRAPSVSDMPPKDPDPPPAVDVSVPETVARLYALMQNNPVKIRTTPRQTRLLKNPKWERKNWGLSKEISTLVFMDPDCWAHICAHPDETITASNFFNKTDQ